MMIKSLICSTNILGIETKSAESIENKVIASIESLCEACDENVRNISDNSKPRNRRNILKVFIS